MNVPMEEWDAFFIETSRSASALLFLKESVTCYLLLFLLRCVGHLGIVLHHGLDLRLQLVEDPIEQLIIVFGPHYAMPALHSSQRDCVVIELCL